MRRLCRHPLQMQFKTARVLRDTVVSIQYFSSKSFWWTFLFSVRSWGWGRKAGDLNPQMGLFQLTSHSSSLSSFAWFYPFQPPPKPSHHTDQLVCFSLWKVGRKEKQEGFIPRCSFQMIPESLPCPVSPSGWLASPQHSWNNSLLLCYKAPLSLVAWKKPPFIYCLAVIPLPFVLLTIFSNCLCLSARSLCDYYGCEPEQDDCSNNLLCKCKQGMERPNAQVPVCVGECSTCL